MCGHLLLKMNINTHISHYFCLQTDYSLLCFVFPMSFSNSKSGKN